MGIASYIGAHGDADADKVQRNAKALAFSFFFGLTAGLLILGTAAAWFGRLLAQWSAPFAMATAVLSIVAGLVALLGPVMRRLVTNPAVKQRGGAGGAFVYGLLFTVATITTSAGPLMLLLTIAAAMGKPLYGALLSLAYGIGRGLPFLLIGLFASRVTAWVGRMERGRRAAEVVSGAALVGVGVYFLTLTL